MKWEHCVCFVCSWWGGGVPVWIYAYVHMYALQWLDRRWGISGAGEGEEKEEEEEEEVCEWGCG